MPWLEFTTVAGFPERRAGRPVEIDNLEWVWNHANAARGILLLYEHVALGDRVGLADLLSGVIPDPTNTLATAKIFVEGHRVRLTPEQAEVCAEEMIAGLLDAPLAGVLAGGVRYRVLTRPLRLVREAPFLLSAIYLHLAELVTKQMPVARCYECSSVFVVTDKRQRFCPAGPPWARATESTCAARSRKRKYLSKQEA